MSYDMQTVFLDHVFLGKVTVEGEEIEHRNQSFYNAYTMIAAMFRDKDEEEGRGFVPLYLDDLTAGNIDSANFLKTSKIFMDFIPLMLDWELTHPMNDYGVTFMQAAAVTTAHNYTPDLSANTKTILENLLVPDDNFLTDFNQGLVDKLMAFLDDSIETIEAKRAANEIPQVLPRDFTGRPLSNKGKPRFATASESVFPPVDTLVVPTLANNSTITATTATPVGDALYAAGTSTTTDNWIRVPLWMTTAIRYQTDQQADRKRTKNPA
jgi:hypothetical protein